MEISETYAAEHFWMAVQSDQHGYMTSWFIFDLLLVMAEWYGVSFLAKDVEMMDSGGSLNSGF